MVGALDGSKERDRVAWLVTRAKGVRRAGGDTDGGRVGEAGGEEAVEGGAQVGVGGGGVEPTEVPGNVRVCGVGLELGGVEMGDEGHDGAGGEAEPWSGARKVALPVRGEEGGCGAQDSSDPVAE